METHCTPCWYLYHPTLWVRCWREYIFSTLSTNNVSVEVPTMRQHEINRKIIAFLIPLTRSDEQCFTSMQILTVRFCHWCFVSSDRRCQWLLPVYLTRVWQLLHLSAWSSRFFVPKSITLPPSCFLNVTQAQHRELESAQRVQTSAKAPAVANPTDRRCSRFAAVFSRIVNRIRRNGIISHMGSIRRGTPKVKSVRPWPKWYQRAKCQPNASIRFWVMLVTHTRRQALKT